MQGNTQNLPLTCRVSGFFSLSILKLGTFCNSNLMGREALEGLRVSPKPAAGSQQENQQTDHFPSRYCLSCESSLFTCWAPEKLFEDEHHTWYLIVHGSINPSGHGRCREIHANAFCASLQRRSKSWCSFRRLSISRGIVGESQSQAKVVPCHLMPPPLESLVPLQCLLCLSLSFPGDLHSKRDMRRCCCCCCGSRGRCEQRPNRVRQRLLPKVERFWSGNPGQFQTRVLPRYFDLLTDCLLARSWCTRSAAPRVII